MPSGMVVKNLNGLRFVKGFLYATAYNPDGSARTADLVAHGALQDISISHAFTYAKLMGPEALPPLGIGITEENLTFSAKAGVVALEHFASYIGGSVAFDGTNSTYTKNVNEEQQKCDLKLKTPSDGSDMTVRLYGCIVENCAIIANVANRGFHIGDISGQVYGQGATANSKLFDIVMPGNATLSS